MPIDYRMYPPDWKTRIVPAVLERANYECELCGFAQGQSVISSLHARRHKGKLVYHREWTATIEEATGTHKKVVKVVLTVMHLDHDRANWNVSLDRLRAACQNCHLKYDNKVKFSGNKHAIPKG
jgi:5-methylcytosine-specific restriction endonuclease McrA